MTRSTTLITLFILLIGIASITRTVILLWDSNLPDLLVFYKYAKELIQGLNPYETEHIFSPPIALLMFTPFILFPLAVAQKIWLLTSIIFFISSLILLKNVFNLTNEKLVVVFTLSVISFPLKFTLGMGQTNILILFFISLFFYFFIKKREKISVIFLSLAIALKLFPSILAIELVYLRKWKVIAVLIASIIVLFSIPIFLTGKFINVYHINNILLPLIINPPTITVYYDQSITGFLDRLNSPYILSSIIRYGLLGLTLFVAYRHKNKPAFAFILLLTGFLLTNKFTWQHQLILLIPAFYYFLSKKLSLTKELLLATAYLLMMINLKNPVIFESYFFGNLILTHGFYGIFIIWGMLITDHIKSFKTLFKTYFL